jgi:peptidoglycan/xylan/chitin deacetylase (PgdA/CDA1 family)
MSIQSHTRSHPFLSELVSAAVREELAASRDVLNEKLEQRTTSLSLPGGDVPRPAFRHHLAESGYTAVATSRWGVNRPDSGDGPVWVRRCTVNGNVPADVFRRIALGDPWLALRRRVREASLAAARRAMGPSRYARLRRAALDALGRASSPTDSG